MKVNFSHRKCANFNLASNKEWLETNVLNGYSTSTIYGLNNRRYQGLLVVPVGDDQEKMIILSKFEESIFIGNQVYELSTNQFKGGIYPDGYKYIKNFSIDPFPKFLYEIENKRIEKTLFLLHDQHTLVIRYAYKDQGPPLNIVLKPMIAGRRINELTHEMASINTDSYLETGVVKIAPIDNVPQLNIYFQKGEYLPAPLWYHNYIYERDSRRKQGYSTGKTEDLYNPGFFTCTLAPYETFDLYVTVESLTDFDYEAIYRREKEYRNSFDPGARYLSLTARDISKRLETLSRRENKALPIHIADYPQDQQTSGKFLFSLFGLSVLDMNKQAVQDALLSVAESMHKNIRPDIIGLEKELTDGSYHYADLPLIFIYLLYYLYDFRIDQSFIEANLLDVCKTIIEEYSKDSIETIRLDKDGLLNTGNATSVSSWFLPKSGEKDRVRHGYLIEINALWYNALKIMEFFSRKFGKKRQIKKYAPMAELTRKSFVEKFWSTKHLQYFDHIDNQESDTTFSISQILLIALPFSPLDAERGLFILKQIEEHLLTPYGLRSLSPNAPQYKGRLYSPKQRYDRAYYNGSVWPWTIGLYIDAVINFRGEKRQTIENLKQTLDTLGQFFYEQGLGNISTIFEGNPPHRRNGQICSALNLSELLRAHFTVYRTEKEREGFSEYV